MRKIAELIPAEYRKEILELNMISRAFGMASNPEMRHLFIIWKNHVEPNASLSLDCGMCMQRILKNFRELQQTFIDMEKESKLLKAV